MAYKYQANGLAVTTGIVMIVGTFIHPPTAKKQKAGATQFIWDTGSTFGRIILILIVVTALSVLTDQVPEFGGPFTLLILVAYLINLSHEMGQKNEQN